MAEDVPLLDISVSRGEDLAYPLTFKRSDGTTIDVSGWDFLGKIREGRDNTSTLLWTFDSANSTIDMTDAAAGTILLVMTDSEVVAQTWTVGYMDFFGVDDNGRHRKLFKGKFEIDTSITY